MTAAIGKDWADVLEGLPENIIQAACIQYQRDEPRRKPTPGAIYQIARALMPKPQVVATSRKTTPEEDAEYMSRAGRGHINEQRKAEAEAILSNAGYANRIGGSDD